MGERRVATVSLLSGHFLCVEGQTEREGVREVGREGKGDRDRREGSGEERKGKRGRFLSHGTTLCLSHSKLFPCQPKPSGSKKPLHKVPRACRFLETLVLTLGPWLSKFSDHDPTVRESVSEHPDRSNRNFTK